VSGVPPDGALNECRAPPSSRAFRTPATRARFSPRTDFLGLGALMPVPLPRGRSRVAFQVPGQARAPVRSRRAAVWSPLLGRQRTSREAEAVTLCPITTCVAQDPEFAFHTKSAPCVAGDAGARLLSPVAMALESPSIGSRRADHHHPLAGINRHSIASNSHVWGGRTRRAARPRARRRGHRRIRARPRVAGTARRHVVARSPPRTTQEVPKRGPPARNPRQGPPWGHSLRSLESSRGAPPNFVSRYGTTPLSETA